MIMCQFLLGTVSQKDNMRSFEENVTSQLVSIPLRYCISSPGGSVDAGMAIFDTVSIPLRYCIS